jgi:hypothetical protein
MSRVTDTILCFCPFEKGPLAARLAKINEFFAKSDGREAAQGFVLAPNHEWYGGSKRLQRRIFVGAFNCLCEKELLEHLRTLSWEYPESVDLFVHGEDDEEGFRWLRLQPKRYPEVGAP